MTNQVHILGAPLLTTTNASALNVTTAASKRDNLLNLIFLKTPFSSLSPPAHEPLALALMSVFLVCQLGCICLILGLCYVGQFTLSFTACCLSGSIIRVGGCKALASGPVDVEEAVAEQLTKESIKASAKRGAAVAAGNVNSGDVPKSAKKSGKK